MWKWTDLNDGGASGHTVHFKFRANCCPICDLPLPSHTHFCVLLAAGSYSQSTFVLIESAPGTVQRRRPDRLTQEAQQVQQITWWTYTLFSFGKCADFFHFRFISLVTGCAKHSLILSSWETENMTQLDKKKKALKSEILIVCTLLLSYRCFMTGVWMGPLGSILIE